MTLAEKITAIIESDLHAANGRRRERLLSAREIAQVLTEAMRDGYGYTTGGSVAKSYKYRASTTKAFAVANGPDYIALKTDDGDAKGSPVSFAGPSQATRPSIDKWAARQTLYTLRPEAGWLVLTRRECRLFVRSIAGIAIPKDLPVAMVTVADSLSAGNCRMTTERVATWFPDTAVSSKELIRTIQSREPLLMPFALRAIRYAAQRVAQ